MKDTASTQRPAASAAGERRASGGASVVSTALRGAGVRFYVCLGILVATAAGMQAASGLLGTYLHKERVPLLRHFYEFDRDKLLPEYEFHPIQPPALDPDTESNLGADEYAQWVIRDRTKDRNEPARLAHVFVTYYTGQPDMVPHQPKECLAATGFALQSEDSLELRVPVEGREDALITTSVLEFAPPNRGSMISSRQAPALTVLYFFFANGEYMTSRNQVRMATQNLWDRHAYYSKVEVYFTDDPQDPARRQLAGREASVEAYERLMRKLMPILLLDHFQDWEALESQAEAAGPADPS